MFEAFKLVLDNNSFLLNKNFFHQITGTATGTIAAPTYSILVIGYPEIQFYQKYKNEFCVNSGKYTEGNCDRILFNYYIALNATNINHLKLFRYT